MVSVPLIFQPPTTKLDCKTGRNKSTNTVILFLFLICSYHEATEKFTLRVFHAVREGRIGKTLENTSEIHKIIHKVMTGFTGFSKLKERGRREIATSVPSLHIKQSHIKLSVKLKKSCSTSSPQRAEHQNQALNSQKFPKLTAR